ncbi:hypothetical protein REA19_34570 [Prescottella equi]|nr:hypothetical protein REA19_34570 [Prescottella equi]
MHDHGALRGECGSGGAPIQQRHTELPLELFDRAAPVGLRHSRVSACRAEASVVVDAHEQFQDIEVGPAATHSQIVCAELLTYPIDMPPYRFAVYRTTVQ